VGKERIRFHEYFPYLASGKAFVHRNFALVISENQLTEKLAVKQGRPISCAAVSFPAGADQIWLVRRRADQNSAGGGAELFRRQRRNSAQVRRCAHRWSNEVNSF